MFARLFALALATVSMAFAAHGQGRHFDGASPFVAQTQLVGLSFDGMNSGIVRQAAASGFELSSGAVVDLSAWYSPRLPNLTAVFSTEIRPGLSMIWGGSLGESGAKYSLGPSGVIGFSMRRPVGRNAQIVLQAHGKFGGALTETPCVGDYGALGGVQTVNCRLAASALPPAQTLGYLWNLPAAMQATVKLTYEWRF